MQMTVNILMMASSLVALVASLLAINEMTAATNHWIRISYCLISTAALAGILVPFIETGWQPSPACFFGMAGVSILLVVDRRKAARLAANRHAIRVIHQQQGHG